MILLNVYVVIFCLAWLVMYGYLMWTGKRLAVFHKAKVVEPDSWPRLSIIVPACNEADNIERAVRSLLSQDYPDFELILIDDRSTDTTGQIIDKLAQQDSRIRALTITHLPDGWLGKVHALHQGVQQASGEWLLFTDADVNYRPGALRRAVAYVLNNKIDHLTMLANVVSRGYWLDVVINTFGLLFLVTTRAAGINQPGNRQAIGVGAFNLLSREIYERSAGFEWLRLEVLDDMGVGLLVKNAGGQSHFMMAPRDLSVEWYSSLTAMYRGLEKNLFGAAGRYRVWRVLLQVGLMLALVAAPVLALFSSTTLVFASGVAALFMHLLFALFFYREKQTETLSLLMCPVGLLLLGSMMLRSAYLCVKNGGIDWRGTYYPIEELRAGQRVMFKP